MRTLPYTSRLLALGLLLLVFAGCSSAQKEPVTPKTVRVLAIGNSFSYNATQYLPALAKAAGHELTLGHASMGGASLEGHWKKVERYQADPNDPGARYGHGKTLQEMLTQEPWDYVTMQQFSRISHDTSKHQPFADNLAAYVREYAPTAEILVHQIWAYRLDDPRFTAEGNQPGEPRTPEEMHEQVTAAYEHLADHLGARLIPTGDAFYRVSTDPRWGFRAIPEFDPASLQAPELPEQPNSLHVGWHWGKDKEGTPVLRRDTTHAGMAGRYLGACVWFEVLFNESVVGNPFVPEGLDPEYAAFLQKAAHEAVAKRAKWNARHAGTRGAISSTP